jgi:hypothetical protein
MTSEVGERAGKIDAWGGSESDNIDCCSSNARSSKFKYRLLPAPLPLLSAVVRYVGIDDRGEYMDGWVDQERVRVMY